MASLANYNETVVINKIFGDKFFWITLFGIGYDSIVSAQQIIANDFVRCRRIAFCINKSNRLTTGPKERLFLPMVMEVKMTTRIIWCIWTHEETSVFFYLEKYLYLIKRQNWFNQIRGMEDDSINSIKQYWVALASSFFHTVNCQILDRCLFRFDIYLIKSSSEVLTI